MIFRLKHRLATALLATLLLGGLAWLCGADAIYFSCPLSWPVQIGWGLAGAAFAIACDGLLHQIFTYTLGPNYVRGFHRHGQVVLGPMQWPEYISGGLMAALAEEPLFHGILLSAFDRSLLGVFVVGLAFALCHWLRREFWLFWLWALWEGILFGLLVWGTGSLLAAMLAHGLHDLIGYRVFQTLLREQPPRDAATD